MAGFGSHDDLISELTTQGKLRSIEMAKTTAPVSASVSSTNRKIWIRLLLMIRVRLRLPAGGIGASALMA